jgi:starch phosphorylase
MKVLVNGGLNCSELDGWWAEAYSPEVGWALGDYLEHGNDPGWDAVEASALYDILENEIAPTFYARNDDGLPVEWLSKVRQSMLRLTADFSAHRAVRQYTAEYYLPAAAAFEARRANQCAAGAKMANWRREIEKNWHTMSFGPMRVETSEERHNFRVVVDFGDVDAEAVLVELFAVNPNGDVFRKPMARGKKLANRERGYEFTAKVPATRPAGDFTPRIIPQFPGLAVPLEMSSILWRD